MSCHVAAQPIHLLYTFDVTVPFHTPGGHFVASFKTSCGSPMICFRIPIGACLGSIFRVFLPSAVIPSIVSLNNSGFYPTSDELGLFISLPDLDGDDNVPRSDTDGDEDSGSEVPCSVPTHMLLDMDSIPPHVSLPSGAECTDQHSSTSTVPCSVPPRISLYMESDPDTCLPPIPMNQPESRTNSSEESVSAHESNDDNCHA